ncbi:Immunity protein 26 [Altererythrobacter xiamenensis]|uniref:Immunity protein 26 n=1 Tax=Altererythrobacter xiamenensis TaxID=1316679 RepID=A0A1Y6EKX9_9SPHN|nr:Imm26 family immunity protein [Altererythrobacter xiamenensis]SMQ63247.1 Immunity protein 26 [Altererythrobacter xiamenensis]
MPSKRIRRRIGDILKIDLGDGIQSYAQVADEPLVVFFGGFFTEALPPEQAIDLPVWFRIWVHNDAIKKGRWHVLGNAPLAAENAAEPYFYKQDAITGALSVHHSAFANTGWERPASLIECDGLECAAIWDAEHVEERLRDSYAGRPNQWLESLRIDKNALPKA